MITENVTLLLAWGKKADIPNNQTDTSPWVTPQVYHGDMHLYTVDDSLRFGSTSE